MRMSPVAREIWMYPEDEFKHLVRTCTTKIDILRNIGVTIGTGAAYNALHRRSQKLGLTLPENVPPCERRAASKVGARVHTDMSSPFPTKIDAHKRCTPKANSLDVRNAESSKEYLQLAAQILQKEIVSLREDLEAKEQTLRALESLL
jgi:hypothetical protein